MAGKGDQRRKALVTDKEVEENWKKVFGDIYKLNIAEKKETEPEKKDKEKVDDA